MFLDDLSEFEETLNDLEALTSVLSNLGTVFGSKSTKIDVMPATPSAAGNTRPEMNPVPALDELFQVRLRFAISCFAAKAM